MTKQDKELYKNILTYAVLTVLTTIAMYFTMIELQDAFNERHQQSICIKEYTDIGVARKDVVTTGSTCYIRIIKD